MTKKQAKALLNGRHLKPDVKIRIIKLLQEILEKKAEEAINKGISREEFVKICSDEYIEAYAKGTEEAIRLIKEGYPPEIALNEALGFHANTKF